MTSRASRWTLGIGLLVQVVLVAILLPTSIDGSDETTISSPGIDVPERSKPLTAESGETIAQWYADRWSSTAKLIAVAMRLDWPVDSNALAAGELSSTGWLIYTFTDGHRTLSIYLDRATGFFLADAESALGAGGWPVLDLTTYPRSSTIAAAAADITNGHGYRSACPDSRTTAFVTATHLLSRDGTEIPTWTVTYGDSRYAGTYDVLLQMNALTGEVIKNEARERPC